MFEILLRDNVKARIQLPDGAYVYKVNDNPPVDAQRFFFEEAYKKLKEKLPLRKKPRQELPLKQKPIQEKTKNKENTNI